MYANPQKKTVGEMYCKTDGSLPLHAIQQAHEKIKDYREIVKQANKQKPDKGRILEIGGSTGILLNEFKSAGWEVEGLEPNQLAVRYAKENFGIHMHQKPLEDSPFESKAFDAAIMLHVIEHLHEPNAGIATVSRLLKDNGLLVVETPTYNTLMYRVFGRRERSISCNGHIFFFTCETLKKLLEKNGLKVIRQEKVGRTLTVDRFLWNVGVMSKNNVIKMTLNKLSAIFRLHKVSIHLNLRDMQRVYCTKVST
jgi:2-polyprenyl-3-methyl-5-hydroxy-6-metoxy-1,4-benzoquinol methylase